MSTAEQTFYGIRCDFPGCGIVYDDGEYLYWSDPGQNDDSARDAGWIVDIENDRAYCDKHVVAFDCPDEGDCEFCDSWATDTHLRPMPDTFENRLQIAVNGVIEEAKRKFDVLERDLLGVGRYSYRPDSTSRLARAASQTERTLVARWERACREHKPDITPQELHDLRFPKKKQEAAA